MRYTSPVTFSYLAEYLRNLAEIGKSLADLAVRYPRSERCCCYGGEAHGVVWCEEQCVAGVRGTQDSLHINNINENNISRKNQEVTQPKVKSRTEK